MLSSSLKVSTEYEQYQSKPVNVREKKSSKVLDKRKQVIAEYEGSFDERVKSFRWAKYEDKYQAIFASLLIGKTKN